MGIPHLDYILEKGVKTRKTGHKSMIMVLMNIKAVEMFWGRYPTRLISSRRRSSKLEGIHPKHAR
jgi:hypothetical protein